MKNKNKVYIIRKYILAKSAKHAIKLDRKHEVDDVWVDEDRTSEVNKTGVGFNEKK
jgi:hypothetical protein